MTSPTDERYGVRRTSVRRTSVRSVIQYFGFDHLPENLQPISRKCWNLAEEMLDHLDDGPELTAGLRKLLEAKDCFVRAATTPGSRPGTPVR